MSLNTAPVMEALLYTKSASIRNVCSPLLKLYVYLIFERVLKCQLLLQSRPSNL